MSSSKVDLVEKALRSMVTVSSIVPASADQSFAPGTTPASFDLEPLSRLDENIPAKFKVGASQEQFFATQSLSTTSAPDAKEPPTISRDEYVKAMNAASLLDRRTLFQTLNLYHLELAKPLYSLFYRLDLEELDLAIRHAQGRVNKGLFQFALTLALLHRTDVKASIPSQITYSPYLYFDMGEYTATDKSETEVIIAGKFDFDHESLDLEQRVEYFREDPGLNAHHRHWHEAYLDAQGFEGVAYRDRAGELFYYMHQQMMARYDFERLSVKIPLVEALNNLHEPLPEPYFNKLTLESGKKLWDSRPPNQKLSDISVGGRLVKIEDLERARDRIIEAIDRGYVYVLNEDGTEDRKPLNAPWDKIHANGFPIDRLDYGIDKLGDMVWAFAGRSINYGYYGNLHNEGHRVIGYSHDPKGLYYKQSEGSAMTMLETACRDPIFYRWHTFIDDLFERYKATLPEYKINELEFKGIRIEHFDTWMPKIGVQNELRTKWLKDRVDITDGIPETKKKYLTVEKIHYDFVHLAHEEFVYRFTVYNEKRTPAKGVFRIFIAPIYEDIEFKEVLYRTGAKAEEDARKRNKYLEPAFNKLRRKFIELDKFVETLKPGENHVVRQSTDSSVTVPIKQLFQTVDDAITAFKCQQQGETGGRLPDVSAWCGCGWPEYLLIGRGTPEGLPCHLFAMVSDYETDKIDDKTEDEFRNTNQCCKVSLSYCGVRDKYYPDKKPMGFPFDRRVHSDDLLLKDFVTKTRDTHEVRPDMIRNMRVTDVLVKHFRGEPENGPTII